jgi:hypothetical protein
MQIEVHQFVRKTSAKNILSEKIWSRITHTREYVELVLRRQKMIPYKPYVCGKRVASILGTCKNMTKKCIQFE